MRIYVEAVEGGRVTWDPRWERGVNETAVLGEPGTRGKRRGLVLWSRTYLRGNGAGGQVVAVTRGHSGVST